MNARRLLYWGDLAERRQRRARRGPLGWSPWLLAGVGGIILALEIARRMGAWGPVAQAAGVAGGVSGDTAGDVAGDLASLTRNAGNMWLLVLVAGQTLVVFSTPFRLFWRPDAALIARMAIPGGAVFAVGLWRSVRAAMRMGLPCAVAALAFALGPQGDVAMVGRYLALAGVAAAMAACLGPALTLAAGAIVASDRLRAAMDNMAGEFRAPPTAWLGVLPGILGATVAGGAIVLAPWARGEASGPWIGGTAWLWLLGALALSLAAVAWARTQADAVMLAAMREVSALDQERLAHVEKVQASQLERWVGRLLRPAAYLVFDKDTRLARRRYPIPFFVGVVGTGVMWLMAFTQPQEMVQWAAAIGIGVGVYGAVMARRLVTPPIEQTRFLRTLPVGGADARAAKRMRVLVWNGVYVGLGAIAVVARAAEPATAAAVLGAVLVINVVLGILLRGSQNI